MTSIAGLQTDWSVWYKQTDQSVCSTSPSDPPRARLNPDRSMLPISPEILSVIATLYGVGAAGAALLQARQVVRRGSSCEVSARFFATYAGGYAVWLLYGLSIGSMPLILVDAAGLACGLVTLAITLQMRGSLLRPSTWGSCPGLTDPQPTETAP
jgi:uncharacterized protein with PQ loop repeat